MATPYIIILSDSDDEIENVFSTAYPSDSDNEPNHSEPMEVEYSAPEQIPVTEQDLEEEDPEEEDPEEEDPEENYPEEQDLEEEDPEENLEGQNPTEPATEPEEVTIPSPTYPSTYTSGPRMIYTARKQVAIPRRHRATSTETSNPSTDSYHTPNSTTHRRTDARRWSWLPETLQKWREEEDFPIITEVGESSTAGREYPLTREPPHHTTPLLAVRMTTQELRIDQLEDAVDEIPGTDMYENLGGDIHRLEDHVGTMYDRVTSLEQHFVEVGELAQAVSAGEQETAGRTRNLESRMAQMDQEMIRMQGHIDHLTAMAAASREREIMILRGDHLPKKD